MSVPPPTSTLRSMVKEKHMTRLREIIATLHPEKVEILVDDESICRNATKKALHCLFGYDNCLAGRIAVERETNVVAAPAAPTFSRSCSSSTASGNCSSSCSSSTVQRDKEPYSKEVEPTLLALTRKEREAYEKEARQRELEQSLRQAEDELLQQALLASLEDVPMIDRAHALVQRAATEAKRIKIDHEMQEAKDNLLEHMFGALPLLAGLVSKETRKTMTTAVPQYEPVSGLLRSEQQARYREFVKYYMGKWLSEQTWRGSLDKEHIDAVVEHVESTLNSQSITTPVLGWNL